MKTAILFGATGLVGKHLLNLLIENNEYDKVKIFSRKDIITQSQKIENAFAFHNRLLIQSLHGRTSISHSFNMFESMTFDPLALAYLQMQDDQ